MCSCSLFLHCRSFSCTLVAASISQFRTAAIHSSSRSFSHVLVELYWPVAYFLLFCLSLSLYSKFLDMTINLTLIL